MNDEQKNTFVENQATTDLPQIADLPNMAAVITPVTPLPDGTNRKSLPADPTGCTEEEKTRDAWLNIASEDTLRKLWDTPEEDEAWRDLLKKM